MSQVQAVNTNEETPEPPEQPLVSDERQEPLALEVGRRLPCNYEAEQALLGALFHNNACHETIDEILQPEHFADAVHGRIYSAIRRLIERGHIADPITLKDYFDQDAALEDIGGAKYLIQLADSVVSIINARSYAITIRDLYYRRQLITFGEDVVNEAYNQDLESDAVEQMEAAEQKLFDLSTIGSLDRGFTSLEDAMSEAVSMAEVAFKRDSHVVGVTTGFKDINLKLGGLHPSDLIILAGRPSMGKTAFAMNIAFNAAQAALKGNEGAHVAFFSLEMSAEQLATRLLAQESGVASDKIRRGAVSESDFPKFIEVSRNLSEVPLFIDDTPALSVSALRTRARRLMRQKGLGMIVVDYLQLLQGSAGRRAENRVQEISDITRSLKALAKELNVPVFALSQLSRAVEQRDDKRPQLADLRDSGTIEQDADVVMFIYREEYYESRKQPEEDTEKHAEWQARMDKVSNITEVIIAKQRHGPIGKVKLRFDSALTKCVDYVEDRQ
ncbi:MAG: replicative DNA helicase [Pseudomonadota bacterium]